MKKTKESLNTGDAVSVEEYERFEIVNRIVPADEHEKEPRVGISSLLLWSPRQECRQLSGFAVIASGFIRTEKKWSARHPK